MRPTLYLLSLLLMNSPSKGKFLYFHIIFHPLLPTQGDCSSNSLLSLLNHLIFSLQDKYTSLLPSLPLSFPPSLSLSFFHSVHECVCVYVCVCVCVCKTNCLFTFLATALFFSFLCQQHSNYLQFLFAHSLLNPL